jgi:hypothetical protein
MLKEAIWLLWHKLQVKAYIIIIKYILFIIKKIFKLSLCFCEQDENLIRANTYQSLLYSDCSQRVCIGNYTQKCGGSQMIRFEKIICKSQSQLT